MRMQAEDGEDGSYGGDKKRSDARNVRKLQQTRSAE